MTEPNPVDYAIAVPTFIGSLLSFVGSATALVFQIVRPPRRHFRHSLIVNLLVAGKITKEKKKNTPVALSLKIR